MSLLLVIIVISSIFIAVAYILYEQGIGKYKIFGNSEVESESIKKFENEYPEKNIDDLKIEIEKISEMLLDNEESNRYTYRIQEKAKKDWRLDKVRNSIVDDVEITKYKHGKLQAKVNYILEQEEFTIIMYMNIVKKGRAFLVNYKTMAKSLA